MPDELTRLELVAPCGMNCARCSSYLALLHNLPLSKCAGCRPRGKKCAFLKRDCRLIREGRIEYCFSCPGFPCDRLARLDARYRSRWQTSFIENLKFIQAEGIASFLNQQQQLYNCPRCGGLTCVHNGKCYRCDKISSWKG